MIHVFMYFAISYSTGACRNYLMPGHGKQIISLLLFSLMLKPIILINRRPIVHQQPGHCPGRPRSAGTYVHTYIYICMVIPYRTAKFKSANIFEMAISGRTAKFNSRQYFWLYGMIKQTAWGLLC